MKLPAAKTRARAPAISARRRQRGSGVFDTLREMAISYRLKPGERLSEVELAERLGVSRTPVREALTRLATDGFLVASTRGYMRRPLDVQETIDLYEARVAIERECLRLAVERASDEDIALLCHFVEHSKAQPADAPVAKLVELDEAFHLRIAALAGNAELERMLANLNQRIRFIRWIDMEHVGRDSTQREHGAIARALASRDTAAGLEVMGAHIGRRREQIVDAIAKGLAKIYLAEPD